MMESWPLDGASRTAFTPVQARNDRSFFLRRDGEGSTAYSRRIFARVFTHDVERVLGMEVSTPFHYSRPAAAATAAAAQLGSRVGWCSRVWLEAAEGS